MRKIQRLLNSENILDRYLAWERLHEDRTPLDQDARRMLTNQLKHEEDDGVWRLGATVMLGLPFAASESSVARRGGAGEFDRLASLSGWLWHPFRKESAVFGLTDASHRRRDEESLIPLARHFCLHDYPKTRIQFMQVNDPRWDQMLFHERFQSMCFVGRLGIFGDEAVRRWGNDDCRFGFMMQRRPRNLKAGKLHKNYHCITERLLDGRLINHRSSESNGHRSDYGVVQRYLVRDGDRDVVVVACAGGSALGTLGATIWATKILPEQLGLNSGPLAAPGGLTINCKLEALVHVSAEITEYPWDPDQIQLLKLYADENVWSSQERAWKRMGNRRITLFEDDCGVVRIELDGKPTTLQPNRQTFRLLVALCEDVLQRKDGVVDIDRLSQNRDIWSGGGTRPEIEVRKSLSNLKHRYLRGYLEIDGQVMLDADVQKVKIERRPGKATVTADRKPGGKPARRGTSTNSSRASRGKSKSAR